MTGIFGTRFKKRAQQTQVEEQAQRFWEDDATRSCWWTVLTNALYMAVEDADDLMRSRDPDYAKRLAAGAANIADAALEQWRTKFRRENS